MKHAILVTLFSVFLFTMLSATASQARDVTLQWDPSADSSVSGYKIYYNADTAAQPFSGTGSLQGASPINVNKLTSTVVTGLDPGRSYYFAVTAYNATGTESPYSNIATVSETTPPTVSITSPSPNATISGTVSVTASAADNVGVTKVEFYLNGILKATDTSTPYVYSLSATALAAGTNTLIAKAYDAAGNVGQSSVVSVSVVSDTTAPTVSLTAPANNASVSGTTTISANASDNVGVSKVEFYSNGALLSATNVSPYTYSWNTTGVANGSYTLTAKAYDNTGNVAQTSNVLVTVNNQTADTLAPTASLTAPANNATVSGTVSVTAGASDNVGVSRVEFYVNSVLQATDTTAPYAFSWNTALVVNGVYSLVVKAYDAAGNTAQSTTIQVTVNNPIIDTIASMVGIASPLANSSVKISKNVYFTVSASNNAAVSKVVYYVNGVLDKTLTVAPFSYSIPAASIQNGSFNKVYAKAYDAAGNVSKSATIKFSIQ